MSLLLFDMDGVLVDSAAAFQESINVALAFLGRNEVPENQTRNLMGLHINEWVKKIGIIEDREIDSFTLHYRAHNDSYGVSLTNVFPDVKRLLETLSKRFELRVATVKPDRSANFLLSSLDLNSYFACIHGSNFPDLHSKSEIVDLAIREYLELNPNGSVLAMIGDRRQDIEAAKLNGIISIGVAWGYAMAGELQQAEADFIANDVGELENIIDCLDRTTP